MSIKRRYDAMMALEYSHRETTDYKCAKWKI